MFELDSSEVRKFLGEWFNDERHQFGQFRNRRADNIDEYIDFIKTSYLNKEPAFQSVQPVGKFRRMFWEFDTKEVIENVNYLSSELDSIWLQTISLVNSIREKGVEPFITYSGRRGFHIWVYTYELPIREDNLQKGKALYKKLIYDVIGNIRKYPDLDKMPLHGNAMARIPFSYHQKSGNQVIPLTLDRKPYIPNLEIHKLLSFSKIYISNIALVVDELIKSYSERKITEIKDWKIRPCLMSLFLTKPDHHVNLALVIDAIYAKMTDEQIHDIYKLSSQYDEGRTQYQIDYQREQIEKEGYRPVGKERLREWGICDDCGKCGEAFNPWKVIQ